ncbi:hypothetical protein [Pseudoprimorskyibacter insulae]|uniref:Dihydroorotate dehydrogenase n=1 Tax=Pseudoprimorskyibacter insulae TaxID=1695997 RepID=A0A2R8APX4_9RHOB|nr:hypothetical protein [Pseudoprimorskyibacter insulae]SPF78083.1 hypothetical protein PRI8871_00673 [Pseudoprimorskyibacter insulae]
MTDKRTEDMLDTYFTAARDDAPLPSGDFMARMQAMALAEQPVRQVDTPAPSWWQQILSGIGGWPAIAGLAAATVAGVWIGAVPPEAMSDSVSDLFGVSAGLYDSSGSFADPLSGFDLAFSEG